MSLFSKAAERTIHEMRGLPIVRTKAVDRAAVPLDNLIHVVLEEYRIGQNTFEHTLMTHWRNILGDSLASRCSPRRLDPKGVLLIASFNPTLRQELVFQQSDLLRKIRSLPGGQAVRALRFI